MAAKTAWGLEIAQTAVRVVKMQRQKHQAEIIDYAVFPIESTPDDPDWQFKALDLVENWIVDYKVGKTPVVLSFPALPGFVPLFRDFLLPAVKSNLRGIVELEAKQQIPYPLEDVLWDYYRRDTDHDSGEYGISLICCRRDIIEAMLEFLEETGLNIAAIQVGPVALVNFLMYDQPPEKATLLLDSGARGTEFIVVNGDSFWLRPISTGGNVLTRELMQKFNMSYEEAAELKHKLAESNQADRFFKVLEPTLRQLSGEIQRSLGFYKSIFRGVQIEQTICAGGAFLLNGFDQFLADTLGMPVTPIKDVEFIQIGADVDPDQLRADMPRLGTCVGLALQGIGEAPIPINLLPPEIIKDRMIWAKLPYAVGVVLLLLLTTVVSYFTAKSKVEDHQDLLAQMVDTNDAVARVEREYADAERPFAVESQKNLRLAQVATNRGDMRAAQARVFQGVRAINVERSAWTEAFLDALATRLRSSRDIRIAVRELTEASAKRPVPYPLDRIEKNVEAQILHRVRLVSDFYRKVFVTNVVVEPQYQTWFREKTSPWRILTPAMKAALEAAMADERERDRVTPLAAELVRKDIPVASVRLSGYSVSNFLESRNDEMKDATQVMNVFVGQPDFVGVKLSTKVARLAGLQVPKFNFEPLNIETDKAVGAESDPFGPTASRGAPAPKKPEFEWEAYRHTDDKDGLPTIEFDIQMIYVSAHTIEAITELARTDRGDDGSAKPVLDRILIARSTEPWSGSPLTNGTAYNVGDALGAGKIIAVTASMPVTFVDAGLDAGGAGLESGATYHYFLCLFGEALEYATPMTARATAGIAPTESPTGGVVAAGMAASSSITIAWTTPEAKEFLEHKDFRIDFPEEATGRTGRVRVREEGFPGGGF